MDHSDPGSSGAGGAQYEPLLQPPGRDRDFIILKDTIETSLNGLNHSVVQQLSELSDQVNALADAVERIQDRSNASVASGPGALVTRLMAVFGSSLPSDGNIDSSNALQDIEHRIRELQSHNKSLASETDCANQEKERMRKQAESFRLRYTEAELHRRQWQEKSTKYRDIIVNNMKNDKEPTKDDLVFSFLGLRMDITRIVWKQYELSPAKLPKLKNPLLEEQRAFFEAPYFTPEVYPATKICFMEGKLFAFLREEILEVANFGMGEDMEDCLAEFEVAVKNCGKAKARDISKWRTRTMKCAAWLNGQSTRPEKVAKSIAQFMEPLLAEPSEVQQDIHYQSILRLCQDAYQFSLVLRKSKYNYEFVPLSDGAVIEGEAGREVTSQGFDSSQESPDNGFEGYRVAFTSFGGLISCIPGTGERSVVVQAHVVCRTETKL